MKTLLAFIACLLAISGMAQTPVLRNRYTTNADGTAIPIIATTVTATGPVTVTGGTGTVAVTNTVSGNGFVYNADLFSAVSNTVVEATISASGAATFASINASALPSSVMQTNVAFTNFTANAWQGVQTWNGASNTFTGTLQVTNSAQTNGVLIQPGPTNQIAIIGNEAGNSTSNGIWLSNPQAASSGNQMYSPAITFDGQGWKTASTAASQDAQFRIYTKTVQGSASPNVQLWMDSSINGAAFVNQAIIDPVNGIQSTATGAFEAGAGGSGNMVFVASSYRFESGTVAFDSTINKTGGGTNILVCTTPFQALGYSSKAVNATVAIVATGITNNMGVNACAYVICTATTFTNFNNAGTAVLTNTTATFNNQLFILQPGGSIQAASGLSGTLVPF